MVEDYLPVGTLAGLNSDREPLSHILFREMFYKVPSKLSAVLKRGNQVTQKGVLLFEFAIYHQWFILRVPTLNFLTIFHLNSIGRFSDSQSWCSFLIVKDPIYFTLIVIHLVQAQPFTLLKLMALILGRTLALLFLLLWEADLCGEQLLHFRWDLRAIQAALSLVGTPLR